MLSDHLILEEIETPFSSIGLFRLFHKEPYPFFLDSGMDPQKLGRFSFLGFDPFLILKTKGDMVTTVRPGCAEYSRRGNPFIVLKELLERYRLDAPGALPPFTCGAVGYLSYDLCRHLENVPSGAADDLAIPDMYIGFYDRSVIFDHLKDRTYAASCGFPEEGTEKRANRARERLDDLRSKIASASATGRERAGRAGIFRQPALVSNFTREEYVASVRRAKEYIASGDI
jgi:para-aminobenzoate synthetase component 1